MILFCFRDKEQSSTFSHILTHPLFLPVSLVLLSVPPIILSLSRLLAPLIYYLSFLFFLYFAVVLLESLFFSWRSYRDEMMQITRGGGGLCGRQVVLCCGNPPSDDRARLVRANSHSDQVLSPSLDSVIVESYQCQRLR
jgi:hypothetical protein